MGRVKPPRKRRKKKSRKQDVKLQTLILITALLNLISALITLLSKLNE